jgi:hypothetical protein
VVGLGAVQVRGAATGHGLDRGVVVVDGDGVLVQGDGDQLASVNDADLNLLAVMV